MSFPSIHTLRPSMAAAFECGDRIEVSSKEDGYVGSYYAARIIARINPHRTNPSRFRNYIVEYKTLVTDDHSRPLRETVSDDEVRPVPPRVPAMSFRVSDLVDAYDNDGWWVGVVTKIIAGYYFVYFDLTNEEIAYSFDRVRVHHDWINGKWIPSSNSKFKLNQLHVSDC